ncbi:hypothetical protein Gasu2_28930 [Galdieria sulphuraria]|uniref:CCT domain-containing protein n=1 Tax=Galdieria sulphuraria TaxID=130081 RepID=M2XJU2_GALSU|nr:uncharacterized protein Gasu_22840 [Galdieria sulphuraria]EME30377.1 hypothetical protein Gasu_22840 [Galdieria sulphuraria]GJD08600.1 hypothetical protein Gasu2_28930 [Galdieria sulphuraria]|eukprot:XP_005706897.1 hypothetical protein Gasu_22840 [Galdieria sulphuraria]
MSLTFIGYEPCIERVVENKPLDSPCLLEIYQAIDGNGLFCLPPSDSKQTEPFTAATLNELFKSTVSNDKTTKLQNYKDLNMTEAPKYLNFLPKPELFYPVMLNKDHYRKIRFQRYRNKKYKTSNSSKVRYIERQKLAQRRFRLHGKFVSKQVQIAMAAACSDAITTVESNMELAQSNTMDSSEELFFWPTSPFQDEQSDISFWYMTESFCLDESDMF